MKMTRMTDPEDVELTDGQNLIDKRPCPEKIQSYLGVRKRTRVFDVCVLMILFVVFAVTLGLIVHFVILPSLETTKPTVSKQVDMIDNILLWQNTYSHIGSESVLRAIDVNDDGIDDAIFGVAHPSNIQLKFHQYSFCLNFDKGCLGLIMALDGKTGESIWNITTLNEVFEINCGNIDINQDGRPDCIGTGRRGTYTAFDYKTGSMLWEGPTNYEAYIEYPWNIYNPLVLDDFDGDEVPEVLLPHGGNPDYPPENRTRVPGRFIMFSGRKGRPVESFKQIWIDMPDNKETYSSPVLHKVKNGTRYILFGTGGETVAGSLFAITIENLVKLFKSPKQSDATKNFITIYQSSSKGVMIPVVLADLNADGHDDIVMSAFDGTIAAYDGDTFAKLWSRSYGKAESYTTPGIGYFNNDTYLDLMLHWNYGVWPEYNRSSVTILSGKDGMELWEYKTGFSVTSDLVVKTNKQHQDVFIFRAQHADIDDGIGVIHGVDPQRKLVDSEDADMIAKKRPCDQNLTQYDSEIHVVDWNTKSHPVKIYSKRVKKLHYGLEKGSKDRVDLNGKDMCALLKHSSRTTGALGDLNGDGKIDLVISFDGAAVLTDKTGNYVGDENALDVLVLQVEKLYGTHTAQLGQNDLEWLPIRQQTWTGYMNGDSNSKYGSFVIKS